MAVAYLDDTLTGEPYTTLLDSTEPPAHFGHADLAPRHHPYCDPPRGSLIRSPASDSTASCGVKWLPDSTMTCLRRDTHSRYDVVLKACGEQWMWPDPVAN